jgi:hypothetical protein
MFSPKRVNLPRGQKQDATGKRKAIETRMRRIEAAIKLANEYRETGEHADWHGFRPLFVGKFKDGEPCPPHKDWVKNVFVPRCLRQIASDKKALKRLEH